MKIEDVMTRRVVAARADTDLSHVARLMWDNDCGCVPVVDAEDKVVGVLTDRDLGMSALFQGRSLRELHAGSCMAADVATCGPKTDVLDVVELMGRRRIRRVPVTDAGGRLLGVVALSDLFGCAARARKKERKALQAGLVAALTAITDRPLREEAAPSREESAPSREEVVPALPAKKRGSSRPVARSARSAKPAPKKRARI